MSDKGSPYRVGTKVFVRTVTHYYTGRVLASDHLELLLEDAAWIADTGRFSAALKDGTLNEVEPFPDVVSIGRGAIVDVCEWLHELPRTVK